jgi:chromate transporter
VVLAHWIEEALVNLFLLYLVMLKATVTTFNGPMSLPILRDELIVKRQVITDRELTAAVAAAQASPGPMGIYVVSVGYFVAGIPGAVAGFFALITPAFLGIPLIRWLGVRLESPRAQRMLSAAVLASAGLIVTSAVPLAQASIHTWHTAALALLACVLVATSRIPTVLIIAAAGVVGAISSLLA